MGFWARLVGKTEFDTTVTDYAAGNQGDDPLRVSVEDVFVITGRGTVATGMVSSGTITVGQQVRVQRVNGEHHAAVVAGVETLRKRRKSASAGQNVGVVLDGIARDQIERGDELIG